MFYSFMVYGRLWLRCCQFVVLKKEKLSAPDYKVDIQKYSLPICFLELIRLLGDIEPEHSLSYRFGLAWLALAQFGPTLKAPLTQLPCPTGPHCER